MRWVSVHFMMCSFIGFGLLVIILIKKKLDCQIVLRKIGR